MLKVSNLESFYGAVQVVWDVSFDVNQGEVVSIIGANGAGKTTILKSVAGLTDHKGSIRFNGREIGNLPAHKMAELGIAYVPEGRKVFPQMTVLENLRMGSFNKRARTEREESIANVLDIFPRLKERAQQYAGNLSGGEQQMLAIGRGLTSRPSLLLLDEPSLGIAPIIVDEIFATIQQLKKEITIVLVEQHVHHALAIADKGYVIEHGKIAISGTGKELQANEHVKKAYLGI
ncbi:ABC transporter ATP-binding protein [Brevibacillus agri]|uniref:ABC transporter ATP-binding protein n=1 Tax=Brevibacillus agri TaxID=51101 RepID=UPI003D1DBC31